MNSKKIITTPINEKPIKPLWMVLGATSFAFAASFIATSLKKYGGFNYSGHATVLSDTIIESIGAALLLPLIHLAISLFWEEKRNPASQRNIFFGWGLGIGVLQILLCFQVAGSPPSAESEKIVNQPEKPVTHVERLYTLDDWYKDTDHVLNVQSSESLPKGVKLEFGCVSRPQSMPKSDCVTVKIKRQLFDKVRVITPKSQADLEAPGKSPLLLPFVLIEDGKPAQFMLFAYLPENMRGNGPLGKLDKNGVYRRPIGPVTKISIITGDKLSFERSDYNGLMDLPTEVMVRKLGIPSDRMAPAVILSHAEVKELLLSHLENGVSVKFEGSDDIYLSDSNAKEFKDNLEKMILVYYDMIINIGDMSANIRRGE